MSDLKGKVAIVTGAASKYSMGRACVMQLASEGADIVVVDKFSVPPIVRAEDSDWRGMPQIIKDVEAIGGKAIAVEADMGVAADIDKVIDTTMKEFGKIDILVHCAGVRGPNAAIVDLPLEKWQMLIDVNLTGVFLLCKGVGNAMLKDPNGTAGKKVVLFASQAGVEAMPHGVGYCAAKHGVIGITKVLALELADYGINVNCISPMAFDTNFRDAAKIEQAAALGISIEESMKKDVSSDAKGHGPVIPIGRHGRPEDAAKCVSFLVSEGASYITGQNILMNGGYRV